MWQPRASADFTFLYLYSKLQSKHTARDQAWTCFYPSFGLVSPLLIWNFLVFPLYQLAIQKLALKSTVFLVQNLTDCETNLRNSWSKSITRGHYYVLHSKMQFFYSRHQCFSNGNGSGSDLIKSWLYKAGFRTLLVFLFAVSELVVVEFNRLPSDLYC